MSHLVEHAIWCAIIQRCTNPKNKRFSRYGGRGIYVCDRWLYSFAAFFADMGARPSPVHTVEREDNDGNYEPKNCIWLPQAGQARNRINNHLLAHDGVCQTIAAWAEVTGISPQTIAGRIARGWAVPRALTELPAYRGLNKHRRRAFAQRELPA